MCPVLLALGTLDRERQVCPTFTHGAICSGNSAASSSGSILTREITGACVSTNSPGETRRFYVGVDGGADGGVAELGSARCRLARRRRCRRAGCASHGGRRRRPPSSPQGRVGVVELLLRKERLPVELARPPQPQLRLLELGGGPFHVGRPFDRRQCCRGRRRRIAPWRDPGWRAAPPGDSAASPDRARPGAGRPCAVPKVGRDPEDAPFDLGRERHLFVGRERAHDVDRPPELVLFRRSRRRWLAAPHPSSRRPTSSGRSRPRTPVEAMMNEVCNSRGPWSEQMTPVRA